MDKLLQSLLREWDYLLQLQDETLKALPVISRRIHLAVGLQYLIFALAAGKLTGSLVYFWFRMASMG